MSNTATIGVTEVRRGLIASGGSLVRMGRRAPWAHAMELMLLGDPVSAQQALAMGLGAEPTPSDAATFTALVRRQLEVWRRKVADAGIQPE